MGRRERVGLGSKGAGESPEGRRERGFDIVAVRIERRERKEISEIWRVLSNRDMALPAREGREGRGKQLQDSPPWRTFLDKGASPSSSLSLTFGLPLLFLPPVSPSNEDKGDTSSLPIPSSTPVSLPSPPPLTSWVPSRLFFPNHHAAPCFGTHALSLSHCRQDKKARTNKNVAPGPALSPCLFLLPTATFVRSRISIRSRLQ